MPRINIKGDFMSGIDNVCIKFFYENQERLFPKKLVQNVDEAEAFLEECMALVFDSRKELEDYIEDEGIDTSDYEDVTEALEVFALPDGRYLYVEA